LQKSHEAQGVYVCSKDIETETGIEQTPPKTPPTEKNFFNHDLKLEESSKAFHEHEKKHLKTKEKKPKKKVHPPIVRNEDVTFQEKVQNEQMQHTTKEDDRFQKRAQTDAFGLSSDSTKESEEKVIKRTKRSTIAKSINREEICEKCHHKKGKQKHKEKKFVESKKDTFDRCEKREDEEKEILRRYIRETKENDLVCSCPNHSLKSRTHKQKKDLKKKKHPANDLSKFNF